MGNSFTTKHTKDTKEEKIISPRRAFLVPFPFFAVFAFSFRKKVSWRSRLLSFPHAFSGNPGEFRTGPPIKTSGVTAWDIVPAFSSPVGER
jgi:hypothetical protein